MKKCLIALVLANFVTLSFANSDRCNRKVAKLAADKYAINLSPVEMLNLASGAPLNLSYKDLDMSESSCIAKAIYKSDPTQKNAELLSIRLHDTQLPMERFVAELNYQWCFNQLYNNVLDNGHNTLSTVELDHFRNQFETICMNSHA